MTQSVVKAYRHSMDEDNTLYDAVIKSRHELLAKRETFKNTIEEFQKEVHDVAKEKGWYEPGKTKSPMESLMLMVSELAEACEELRTGAPVLYKRSEKGKPVHTNENTVAWIVRPEDSNWDEVHGKLEGVAAELADVFIRLVDFCEFEKIPLAQAILEKHDYNKTRPYRHGNKKY